MQDLKKRVVIMAVILLACGIGLTIYSVQQEDASLRAELLVDTHLAEAGIDPVEISTLTGSQADLSSPVYIRLKKQMTDIRVSDPLIRFAYLLGSRPDGTIFFYVDSEPPESRDYSPPGMVYSEVSQLLKETFLTHTEFTGGPGIDRWGIWMSGLIPITDPEQGKMVALFGLDIDARTWGNHLVAAALPPLFGTIILLMVLFGYYTAGARDLRERRRLEKSEREIRESEAKYRTVFENTGTAAVIIENDTTISLANSQFERLSGYSREDIEGKMSWTSFVDSSDLDRMREQHVLRRQNHDRALTQYEFRFCDRGGVLHHILLTIDVIPGTSRSVASLMDITDRKQMEDALMQANRKLNLLSNITRHDALNQILVLRGFLEIARGDIHNHASLSESLDKAIGAVKNIERQLSFTRDYQELGITTPSWQKLGLTVVRAKGALNTRNIRFIVEGGDIEVYADALFEKVIYNLIANSLRHGGEKLTTVRFTASEDAEGLLITVSDDGVGVAEEMKQHLFERGHGKNMGFGLFLSREILSITNITIHETGTTGQGARFELRVPRGGYRFT